MVLIYKVYFCRTVKSKNFFFLSSTSPTNRRKPSESSPAGSASFALGHLVIQFSTVLHVGVAESFFMAGKLTVCRNRG